MSLRLISALNNSVTLTMKSNSEDSQSQLQSSSSSPSEEELGKKWDGGHMSGSPVTVSPSVPADNQKGALWSCIDEHQPYVHYSPVDRPCRNPFEPLLHILNSWTTKADTVARNIWHNLKSGPSVTEAAWGKLKLTAKAVTEGGFESLFIQTFETDPSEKLSNTYACYLCASTSRVARVAGTLYLSNARVAFCSDRPLSFTTSSSGQECWSYFKVVIPLANVGKVNPAVTLAENYIQILTTDGHEFWFTGFVHFEKASHRLLSSVSDFRALQTP